MPVSPALGTSPPAGDATDFAAVRACLLSGGASRRMGRDKAGLPHPQGGTWLEGTLRLLAALQRPITLVTRHRGHRLTAEDLAMELRVPLVTVLEDGPQEGPLQALAPLMELYPDQVLLVCPVDMPWLDLASLRVLLRAAAQEPERIHVAHDGERLQPLLGLYPTDARHRTSLAAFVAPGGRSLLRWLKLVGHRTVPLPADAMRNCNHPEDWRGPEEGSGSQPPPEPGGTEQGA